jgi:hypothetical protein
VAYPLDGHVTKIHFAGTESLMKSIQNKVISIGVVSLFLAAGVLLAPASADAEEAAGTGSSLTGKMKEAGAVGVGTAADETAKGADMKSAASSGGSAAINHGLGTAAPAAPTADQAAGVADQAAGVADQAAGVADQAAGVADQAAGAADQAAAAGSGLTGKMKEAGAVGVGTAADETAKGADMKSAASSGGSAAINHGLGAVAPAAPEAPAE